MKTHLDINHNGTLGADDRVKMTFDENSIAHLMSVLTDLYSDPELAVIREYSTNALDSHKAANNPAPIEVYLPSSLSPVFVVRDFGTGMSLDDITNHFSKYGWSSKRDTDNEVGMLGLGCKSALTYTSQFTLITVKDGIRATVLVTRDTDGGGAVQVVDTAATDSPNGVEVQVPVKWAASFNQKARDFFWFWEPGVLLLNGQPVTDRLLGPEEKTHLVITDDITLAKGLDHDIIVMGNVPYPVDRGELRRNWSYQHKAVVRVPIGAIDFTPSREALHYTKRTQEVVNKIFTDINENVRRVAQADIDAAPTHAEALTRAVSWREVSNANYSYRGETVPRGFTSPAFIGPVHPDPRQRPAAETFLHWSGSDFVKATTETVLAVNLAQEALHIIGFKGNFTDKVRRQITEYRKINNITSRQVIACAEPIARPWFDGVREVTYEVLKAVPVAPLAKPVNTAERRLDGFGEGAWHRLPIKPGTKVLWIRSSELATLNADRKQLGQRLVNLTGKGIAIQIVTKQSEAKFRRENPKTKHVKTWLAQYANRQKITSVPRDFFIWQDSGFAELDASQVLDPELAKTIARYAGLLDDCGTTSRNTLAALLAEFDIKASPVTTENMRDVVEKFNVKYPLVVPARRTASLRLGGEDAVRPHLLEYVNLVYPTR